MRKATLTNAIQLSVRAALAAGLAVGIAQRLELQYPIYALIAAVIVTDLSPVETRRLGLLRLAGTVLGAALGAALSSVLPNAPWAVALGIFTAMFLGRLFPRKGAARLAGYTCGIVLLTHGDHAWSYALHRLLETALGIGLALLVSWVPKLMHIEVPEEQR